MGLGWAAYGIGRTENPVTRTRTLIVLAVLLVGTLLPTLDARAADQVAGGSASVTHVVKSGDSLFAIAKRYGVTIEALRTANKLTTKSVIQPGQKLVVPGIVLPTKLPPRLPDDIRGVPARLRLLPVFQREAARYKVPEDLLMAVAYTESSWRTDAVSAVGAVGIGQLMPATSTWIARDLIGVTSLDPRVPEDNIRMSARFLRFLLDKYPKNLRTALAAYFEGFRTLRTTGPSRAAQRYARIVIERRPLFTF